MKIILSHPTGNANVRAALSGLNTEAALSEFHTTIASFPKSFLGRLGGFNAFSEVARRSFNPVLQSITNMHPLYEVCRMMCGKAGLRKLIKQETGIFSIDAVYSQLDKAVTKALYSSIKNGNKFDGVYAYEDGAIESFLAAKKLGLKCFYDLPIGYWKTSRMLLNKEAEKWPEWAPTLTGLTDSTEKLKRKDKELQLADRIFVASSFTAKSLQKFEGILAPIEIIPYGFPAVTENKIHFTSSKGPLKILFVGGLSQRKGIAELFTAANYFGKQVSLTVVGKKVTHDCKVLDQQLNIHRWISGLPHEDILALMRMNDVLIFPSLFEGFGLVISEAMSQGTPVITTERTAGPDIINDGENGWLINAGSTDALIAAIENILLNRASLFKVGKAAMQTAKGRPWDKYGKELAEAIIRSLNK